MHRIVLKPWLDAVETTSTTAWPTNGSLGALIIMIHSRCHLYCTAHYPYKKICTIQSQIKVLTVCILHVLFLPLADVHPNNHSDHLCESERLSVPRVALHAEGLRGSLPPRAECAQAHTQPQGRGYCSHHVQQVQPQGWTQTQRRSQDRAVRKPRNTM